jgi:uncharacterized protein YaeQ
MALSATIHRLHVALSDVDRGRYETFDLQLARHPSESMAYMLTRVLAYCLAYEDGIAFSKGGLSDVDEPPLCVRDATGLLRLWIDIGSPSADRLHKASKAAPRVALFTSADLGLLRKEAKSRPIHRVEDIEVYHFAPTFLDALAPHIERKTRFELVHNEGQLYVTLGDTAISGEVVRTTLNADVPQA